MFSQLTKNFPTVFFNLTSFLKNQQISKATGEHFNMKGHKISDTEISLIEKLNNTRDLFRKQREKMFIQKFNSKYKGMNQKT